jgi:hypothetical protein
MEASDITDKIKAHKGLMVLSIVGFAILLILGWLYGQFNGVQKEGVNQEQALNAQYLNAQNELSTYISTFYETVDVAEVKTEALDEVLTDAITGRYDEGLTALGGEGQLISALAEAYPDLSGLDSYDEVIDVVRSGREGFRGQQEKLLDMLRRYDAWRDEDIIRSFFVSARGFPSDRVTVTVAGEKLTGQDALDEMWVIVLTDEARDAYDTKDLAPLTVPNDEEG